jgi:methionyl-tRNA synthetase
VYVTGSDAHGTPIVISAEQVGSKPEEVALKYHQQYKKLLKLWNIEIDNYSITHNPTHTEFCQELYREIQRNGYIFKSKSKQPFCPKCRIFLPDRFVEGTCPDCGWPEARGDQCTNPNCGHLLNPTDLLNPRCKTCGAAPIIKETIHWYFDLPKLRKQLEKFLDDCPILTESARNFAKKIVKEGLEPRPITRDLEWGIPAGQIFKGAERKVLYVWAENILGYLSATKELTERNEKPDEWKKLWQNKRTKTVFCIGKDNTIFHAIIFPALLLATHEPYVLPYAITVTEFITFHGQPFSKSKGIGVGAEEALEVAPADYWRYFLIIERPETKDLNFTWEKFLERVNNDLNNVLGNFVHRTLTFIYKEFDKKVPPQGQLKSEDRQLLRLIKTTARRQSKLIENFRFKDSLDAVLSLAKAGNTYLSSREPWHLIKRDRDAASATLNVAVQVVNALAILIQPYMPLAARSIRKMLNLPEVIEEGEFGRIGNSPLPAGHSILEPKALFKKLDKKEALGAHT